MATISYLDRFLDPITDAFTPELARKVADLQANAQMQERIDYLREKANDGTLTPEEDTEYKEFVEAVDVLSILQSKARKFLTDCSA